MILLLSFGQLCKFIFTEGKIVLHYFPIGKHFTNIYNIFEAWGIICKIAIGTYRSDLYYLAFVNITGIIEFNLDTR